MIATEEPDTVTADKDPWASPVRTDPRRSVENLLSMGDIAELLNVDVMTVRRWKMIYLRWWENNKARHTSGQALLPPDPNALPAPAAILGDRWFWDREDVIRWASQTGRWDMAAGKPLKRTSPGRPRGALDTRPRQRYAATDDERKAHRATAVTSYTQLRRGGLSHKQARYDTAETMGVTKRMVTTLLREALESGTTRQVKALQRYAGDINP